MRVSPRRWGSVRLAGAATAGWLTVVLPAHATLGGAYASVEADRAHMAASLRSTPSATCVVHALTSANGGVTREFTRGDGTVFAVAWRGAGRPDLRQLLGSRFEAMQSDVVVHDRRRLRAPVAVDRSDLVVRSAGHLGLFWGFAYVPQLTPPGFSLGALK